MDEIIEIIRSKSKALLENKQVDAVLGFSRGTLPMARRPFVARTPEQADLLYWDEFCLLNLANFMPLDCEGKVAIVAKGCDWRNLVVHHQEGRVDLENKVFVLGVGCEGMLDPEKVNSAAGGAERLVKVVCRDEAVKITVPDGELSVERETLSRQSCLECIQPGPVTADDWIVKPKPILRPAGADTSSFSPSEDPGNRKKHLAELFSQCLMCFGCRDICPLCYCNQCFVDVEKSHWLSTQTPIDSVLDFHFFRAHHIAGRCTECGACETVCPMNISVRQLVTRLNKDIEKATGYIPGLKLDADPPDGVFRPSYHELSKGRS